MSALSLKIEFGGGLELLFDNKKEYTVDMPRSTADKPTTLTHLILWLKDNLLKERPELFIEEQTV